MTIRPSRTKKQTEPTSVNHPTSSVIALGVHIVNAKPMLWNSFKSTAETLVHDLNLSRRWLGIPYPEIQEDNESHLRLGVIITASVKSGAIRGCMKRLSKAGVEVVLHCPDDTEQEWLLTRVSEDRFSESSVIGRFDLSKLDTLVSLLISQAPSFELAILDNYLNLPDQLHIELCSEPSRGFFSFAHIRYVQRRRAALAAVAASVEPSASKS